MFWRDKKIKKLKEEVECLKCELEVERESSADWMKKYLEILHSLYDLKEGVLVVTDRNKIMLSILKAYAKWDNFLIKNIKGYNFAEGPATLYLKEIGEYDDTYGH